jgi:hypothetical protein
MQKKKKNRSFRLGRHGHIEGFQTSACLRSYLESLYPTRDVWEFCVAIAVKYGQPEQRDSWFNYHVH